METLNIGHIVVHKDIDLTFMRVESPSIFLDQFDRVEDLLISYDSPELNIYELSKYNPQIFATRNIIYSIGNFRDLPAVVSLDNYDQTKAILFTRQYGQDNQIAYSDDFSPFTMSINPSNVVINAQPTQNLDMYELSIPFSRPYELLIRSVINEPISLIPNLPINIGDQTIEANTETISPLPGGWYRLGLMNLKQGSYYIQNNFTQNPVHIVLRSQNQEMFETPDISFVRINPTKYRVHVQDTSNPFLLSFLQSFDIDWQISNSDDPNTEIPHFQVNGYANGWWIKKTGTFDLTIEYFPQKLFNIGLAISIITCAFLIIIAIRTIKKQKL